MNETSFFQAGDDFDLPAGGRAHPLQKGLRVTGVAQSAGGDNADWISDDLLRGAVKAAQDLDRLGHGLGSEETGSKDAFAEAGDLAIFVDGAKAAAHKASDLQSYGIGTDINRGKGRHGGAQQFTCRRLRGHQEFAGFPVSCRARRYAAVQLLPQRR